MSLFGRFRELDPFAGNSKPRLFVERAYRPFGVLPGFFSLLAKPYGILFGHTIRIVHIVAGFNAHFGDRNPRELAQSFK